MPYQNPIDKRIQGRIAAGHLGTMPYSWFYYDLVKNGNYLALSGELLFLIEYATILGIIR